MKKYIFFCILLSTSTHAAIQVAITVDDLPFTATAPIGVSRLNIVEKMISTF